MRITRGRDVGRYLRDQRHAAGLTQAETARRAGVSRRWLSDLEGGKTTAEVGLVLHVVAALGMMVEIKPIPPSDFDLDEYLATFEGPRD